MAEYKENTDAFVFSKQAEGLTVETTDQGSLNLTMEEVAEYTYGGDTSKNTVYSSRLQDVIALVESSRHFTVKNYSWKEITKIDEKYYNRLAVEAGKLTWYADDKTDQEVKWCLDLGIQVFVAGQGFIDSTGEYIVGSSGTYGNTVGDSGEVVPSRSLLLRARFKRL